MKTSIKVFSMTGKSDAPAVPLALYRQAESIQKILAVLMRTYGISTAQLEITPTVPIPDAQLFKKDMDTTMLPNELKAVRRRILKVIKDIMLIYGMNMMTIALSDPEIAELQAYWKYLTNGSTEALDNEHFKDVPLRFDVDPTDKPVAVEASEDVPHP